jgi:hypothetical protein
LAKGSDRARYVAQADVMTKELSRRTQRDEILERVSALSAALT